MIVFVTNETTAYSAELFLTTKMTFDNNNSTLEKKNRKIEMKRMLYWINNSD